MKNLWLILSVIGFIAPNIPVAIESWETGNILLWLDPQATMAGMFGNRISTAFIIDLLAVVTVFFIWAIYESGFRKVWSVIILTLLFGMGGTFPLYLYLKENKNLLKSS